jgi:hypothetical protein
MHAEGGSNKTSNGCDIIVYCSDEAGQLAVSDASTLSTCLKNHFIQTKPKGQDPIINLTTTASAARHPRPAGHTEEKGQTKQQKKALD